MREEPMMYGKDRYLAQVQKGVLRRIKNQTPEGGGARRYICEIMSL
jgi:hypothetical protein